MKIFHSLEEYKDQEAGAAVTLGKFDGVHIGHRKLIRDVTAQAKANGLAGVVFAIDMSDSPVLSHEERAQYLASLGVDVLVECPFTKQFMSMLPEVFIRKVLMDTLHARIVSVGPDFAFGRDRGGDVSVLKQAGDVLGYQTRVLEKEKLYGADVSSTRVRRALQDGDMELAGALLGRAYPVTGIVSHGRRIGTGLGFPTVNVLPAAGKLLPPDGVYASVTTLSDGTKRRGLTNLGVRPTVGGTTRRAETTLFDFHGDVYDERITTGLIHLIRPERRFDSLEELKAQIEKDRKTAMAYFS